MKEVKYILNIFINSFDACEAIYIYFFEFWGWD